MRDPDHQVKLRTAAIADGTAPLGLTVSSLTLALPHDWAAQERMVDLG